VDVAGAKPDRNSIERVHGTKTFAKVDNLDVGRRSCRIIAHREIDSSVGAPANVRVGEEL
jgi:hypothetical protein